MTGATAAILPDGKRLHLQHGPIDLIIEAKGDHEQVRLAYRQAWSRFKIVLDELVGELPQLRSSSKHGDTPLKGGVASRMKNAVDLFSHDHFITPMAAVAGAVADEILSAMIDYVDLKKAYVNNGGDIAIYLADGTDFDIGIVPQDAPLAITGIVHIDSGSNARGIATSGRAGRSHSLGIADTVTVLATSSAVADAAATLIGNAVDLPGNNKVHRVAANTIDLDSDLENRLVTVAVDQLSKNEATKALNGGLALAEKMRKENKITAFSLSLAGIVETSLGAIRRPIGLQGKSPVSIGAYARG